VSAADAIETLTGSPPDYDVRHQYDEEFAEALARVRRCRSAERPGMPLAGAGDVDLLYWLARRIGAECAVETEVTHGYPSLALLLAMRDRPSSRLISTDMPLLRTTGGYVGAAVQTSRIGGRCSLGRIARCSAALSIWRGRSTSATTTATRLRRGVPGHLPCCRRSCAPA